MLRRTVLGALASLVAVSALPTVARAGAGGTATADAGPALPPVLGGLRRTDIAHGPTLTTTVYAGAGAIAQIMVTTSSRGAGDGADERIAPTLRQLHDALIEVTSRQGGTVAVAGENRAYCVGSEGATWTWLGNVYDIEIPRIAGPWQATRRVLLVTGHAGRIVIVSLEMASDRHIDLRALMDELSTILARTRPAPAGTI